MPIMFYSLLCMCVSTGALVKSIYAQTTQNIRNKRRITKRTDNFTKINMKQLYSCLLYFFQTTCHSSELYELRSNLIQNSPHPYLIIRLNVLSPSCHLVLEYS
jgi:hypothetical protein